MVGKIIIDGNDVYTAYGVLVEKTSGMLDGLKMKDPVVNKWSDEHGSEVYLDEVYYEPRDISINCAIVGNSATNLVSKINTFFNAMRASGFRYIRSQHINKGYLVYLDQSSPMTRLSKFNGNPSIGRLTLYFKEPYPINRQWVTSSTSVSFTISCSKTLTIYWGDGSTDTIVGTSQTKNKDYGSGGTRYIVIYGSIETITSLSGTNVTELTN